MLQRVQPARIGLIDGTVSTLAPIFATAFLAGSHAHSSSAWRPHSAPGSAWASRKRSPTTAR